jgi:hypothetical protein
MWKKTDVACLWVLSQHSIGQTEGNHVTDVTIAQQQTTSHTRNSVYFNETTRRYILESYLHTGRREKLKFHKEQRPTTDFLRQKMWKLAKLIKEWQFSTMITARAREKWLNRWKDSMQSGQVSLMHVLEGHRLYRVGLLTLRIKTIRVSGTTKDS